MEGQKCRKCNEIRDFKYFHKAPSTINGLLHTCVDCLRKERQDKEQKIKEGYSHLDLANDKSNIEGAKEILTRMGYMLDVPEYPVWKQFRTRIKDKYGIDLYK